MTMPAVTWPSSATDAPAAEDRDLGAQPQGFEHPVISMLRSCATIRAFSAFTVSSGPRPAHAFRNHAHRIDDLGVAGAIDSAVRFALVPRSFAWLNGIAVTRWRPAAP